MCSHKTRHWKRRVLAPLATCARRTGKPSTIGTAEARQPLFLLTEEAGLLHSALTKWPSCRRAAGCHWHPSVPVGRSVFILVSLSDIGVFGVVGPVVLNGDCFQTVQE